MKNGMLILKSLAGTLFLMLVMGAALFLPFGSFKYSLAWLYLAVFFTPVSVITIYLFLFDKHLLRSRLAVGPMAEPKPAQKLIQSIAGLSFISIFMVSALDYRHKWSNVPLPVSYMGDAFCGIAFVFLFLVFKQNTFLSATISVQEKQRVISTGLYSVIRHPMYTGALMLMIFTPTALGSYWGTVPAAILTAVIIARAIDEERELRKNLVGYETYCSKVKYRLIPYIF
jgi:protein-S-isoprenylcysteine O-methyltransferase Ste14